jgi:hypothetical protein
MSQDVLGYLKFAGYEQTRDQLVRLHQRRLIEQPFHGLSGWRAFQTSHPAGTAERLLRIAQLKLGTKQLDELAWRLWWEGSKVEPDLVRDFLVKMASRWDDRLAELRRSPVDEPVQINANGDRDVLDEVFFQHLNTAPAMANIRRSLGKDSDVYLEFAGLLIDLLRGDFSTLGRPEVPLFKKWRDESSGPSSNGGTAHRVGRAAVYAMQDPASQSYAKIVESLDDRQIENARSVAHLFSRIIASIGEITQDGYGPSGRVRDNVSKSLVALSESPEEQVLSLLLTSSFLKDDRIRANLPDFEALVYHSPAISYHDYLRLRYLVKEIPDLESLMNPARIREAFDSPASAERWRESFEHLLLALVEEFGVAMAKRPDLFGDEPPREDETAKNSGKKDKSKKKKIKNDRR